VGFVGKSGFCESSSKKVAGQQSIVLYERNCEMQADRKILLLELVRKEVINVII